MTTSEHKTRELESVETAIQFRRFSHIMTMPPAQRAAELKKLQPLCTPHTKKNEPS